ncbi:alcohol dehydrogenase [Lacticaseibacillus baoqingensis]|uniref:Alcohol dehydrogenase n=1 Tax=Lacticaseibacillus baoqingensis TaxID=2486013 RepID=A0ABW4E8U0_9LACO|nr:alcohol dehydrogenase [Lacticaseibacillus baoqingensis]
MGKRIDLTGQRFGRLTVIAPSGYAKNGNALWECRCDCGRTVVKDAYRLRHGSVRSCGCLRREVLRARIYDNDAMTKRMGDITPLLIDGHGRATFVRSNRNSSGVIGVSYEKNTQRWIARLSVGGQLVLNERFKVYEDAVAARRKAEARYLRGEASPTQDIQSTKRG